MHTAVAHLKSNGLAWLSGDAMIQNAPCRGTFVELTKSARSRRLNMVHSVTIMLLVLSVLQPAQGESKGPEAVVRAWVNSTPLFDDDFDFVNLSYAMLQVRL